MRVFLAEDSPLVLERLSRMLGFFDNSSEFERVHEAVARRAANRS